MSKNAFVLDDHYGDDGAAREGMILRDMAIGRFNELEKKGLVREASSEEVEKGYQPSIDADPSKDAEGEGDGEGEKDAPKPANKAAPKPANKAA
ncbi:hypothetical protein PQ455_07390 [Sphingomonas naphthae]|uniref:Uncharacterized protein n=1 Tax=Sphingomonas naphthae TaxID=1813468 RepID=A0ABY7TS27_9SPHN|nr:hypothetical protein [Sphingomonas naphthae]WCT75029.1 hypothetical protein PQ455_07390 [Sphingomonas naphthae]